MFAFLSRGRIIGSFKFRMSCSRARTRIQAKETDRRKAYRANWFPIKRSNQFSKPKEGLSLNSLRKWDARSIRLEFSHVFLHGIFYFLYNASSSSPSSSFSLLLFFYFVVLSGTLISCGQEVIFPHGKIYVSFNGRGYLEL